MENEDDFKNTIFKLIQDYLKFCPTIIWGSGGSIPYGLPSMDELKQELSIKSDENLETYLSKQQDEELKKYNKKIFNVINEKDKELRGKINDNTFEALKSIIEYFYNPHPLLLNIITTNYDCVLEYLFSYYNLHFSDGFTGREFSDFNESNFKEKKNINLLKVHGSLRWSKENKYSYYNEDMLAVYPNKEKYKQSSQEPFRTLISKSDEIIKNSKSFLVIGFGFNDNHLTPKLDEAIKKNNTTIVIVTKEATQETKNKINEAKKIMLIEEEKEGKTLFTYKENNELKVITLKGNFWKLEEFKLIVN